MASCLTFPLRILQGAELSHLPTAVGCVSWEKKWGASKNPGNKSTNFKCLLKTIVLEKNRYVSCIGVSKIDKGTQILQNCSIENQQFQVGCWASPFWDIPTRCKGSQSLPIPSMYGIFTYISLTFMLHSWFLHVGKYTSPMDPMGYEFDYMICQYQNQKKICNTTNFTYNFLPTQLQAIKDNFIPHLDWRHFRGHANNTCIWPKMLSCKVGTSCWPFPRKNQTRNNIVYGELVPMLVLSRGA